MARIAPYITEQSVNSSLVGEQIISRVDLHCQRGNSDKVYIIYVYQDSSTNDYIAVAYYGKRGNGLNQNQLYRGQDLNEAIWAANQQANKKERGSGSSAYDRVYEESNLIEASPYQDLDISNFKLPHVKIITELELLEMTSRDDIILEQWPEKNLYLAFVAAQKCLLFHRDTGKFFLEFDHFPNMSKTATKTHDGVIFECFAQFSDTVEKIRIIDMVQHRSIQDIEKKPWKQRRAMLTHVVSELYPKQDPYDYNKPLHLSEYSYDSKLDDFKWLDGIIVAKNINSSYSDPFTMIEK